MDETWLKALKECSTEEKIGVCHAITESIALEEPLPPADLTAALRGSGAGEAGRRGAGLPLLRRRFILRNASCVLSAKSACGSSSCDWGVFRGVCRTSPETLIRISPLCGGVLRSPTCRRTNSSFKCPT